MTDAKIISRQITRWLHRNFMAVSDSLVRAARMAWLSAQVMDRRDNEGEACQRDHKLNLAIFASELAAWRRQ